MGKGVLWKKKTQLKLDCKYNGDNMCTYMIIISFITQINKYQ